MVIARCIALVTTSIITSGALPIFQHLEIPHRVLLGVIGGDNDLMRHNHQACVTTHVAGKGWRCSGRASHQRPDDHDEIPGDYWLRHPRRDALEESAHVDVDDPRAIVNRARGAVGGRGHHETLQPEARAARAEDRGRRSLRRVRGLLHLADERLGRGRHNTSAPMGQARCTVSDKTTVASRCVAFRNGRRASGASVGAWVGGGAHTAEGAAAMSAVELSSDESDWVFDYVMHLFRSPAWEVPIMCFIDDNCASFDTGEENKFIYTDLHQQFCDVVDGVLCSNLAEIGLTAADFADICERGRHSTDISMDVVNQILAMDDFLTFKKLMVKRNLELDLEAIKALRDEALDSQDGNGDDGDVETHLMELSVLYKQEEMEQAELEAAIAMSLALQEEQLRLAAVASKVAEDKFDSSPEKRGLTPEQVHQQIRDTKQRAAELVKRNKEALQENKSRQKELQSTAEIPEDEVKKREEYLRQQRDRILEKKKKERETQLKEYHQEQKVSAPEPPPELAEKLQNATPEELKKSEAEEKRNALRIALARRMKQDLLESATEEPSGGFKVHQLMELDEKMQRVEELRRRSQEREQRVQSRLVR